MFLLDPSGNALEFKSFRHPEHVFTRMRPAAVAVIGGGVMGASVAYHLAARGRRDVVVLDRADRPRRRQHRPGHRRLSRAVRARAINVRLSLLAREKLRRFADETGVDPGYLPAGYLWLAASAAELAMLRAGRADPARGRARRGRRGHRRRTSARLNPAIRLDGIVGGAFCPSDGFIRPLEILEGYLAAARAARRAGRVGRRGDRHSARRPTDGSPRVETSRGPVAVEAVVNAAGPWAAAVAAHGRRRAAGDAAPAPDRHHGAVRPAAGRHADDHLGRRRLPPARARRPGAAALAHARRCRAAVRRHAWIRRGSTPSWPWRTRGCRCSATCHDRSRGELGRALRDVARQACHPRRAPPGAPTSTASTARRVTA